jgi:enoyl-[acyl-carrier-protein] reductase (NADH)
MRRAARRADDRLPGSMRHRLLADKDPELRGKFMDTSLDNFLTTMNISVYSMVAVPGAQLR